MSTPKDAKKIVAPVLDLLLEKIRVQGFTQLEVQEALGWGRSYISQLNVGLKHLHVAEVLSILGVIGVEPEDFFGELYGAPREPEVTELELVELLNLVSGVVNLLVERQLVSASELARAVASRSGEPLLPAAADSGDGPDRG